MIRIHRTTLAALAAILPFAFAACGGTIVGGVACTSDGEGYAVGQSFPTADGCNTCTCLATGDIACTQRDCAAGCTWNEQWYALGESFDAGDGCNSCTCTEQGAACTLVECAVCVDSAGNLHSPGESFPAGDGCNTCMCDDAGNLACTGLACDTCTYAGGTYAVGSSFPATDGCNTCTCESGGLVGCTEIACACDPKAEWWRDYAATDPQTCQVIDYICPPNTTGFSNACGCGCEQDASCPEWFDCMPPAGCDVAALEAKCPYSGIAY